MEKQLKVALLLLVGTSSISLAADAPSTLPVSRININQLVPVHEQPDYDREILVPLHEAQAEAAEKARVAALEAVREAELRRVEETAALALRARQTAPGAVPQGPPGSHTDWMDAAGIQPSDFQYVEYIISHESGWRWWATNNEGSGATGLGQALPASKMAPYGADYLTNPVTQLKWANAYAQTCTTWRNYCGWAGAYAFWLKNHYW